jgi:tetratricopeptide (TPR) repeat protein
MNGIEETKQRASGLRKARKYEEAAELYRTLWGEHRDLCDEWDGWAYAFSLRKLGRSGEALEVCRQALSMNPGLDHLTGLTGWCLYDVEIKRTDPEIQQNEGRFLQAAEEILQLGQPGQYSAHARTLFRVIDYYRLKPNVPTAKILEWCDRLEPEQLSNTPGQGPDGKGKIVAYASDREKWYAFRSRALLDLGRFDECIAFSQKALAAFSQFHHDNDIWFRWRIALSKAGMGDRETAIAELEGLLSRKQDWFIHHRIAQYLLELGRTDEALERAIEAVLAPGPADLGFKWELFLLMGRIHQARGEMEEARRHVLLAGRVRQEQEWKIPAELSHAVSELGVDMSEQVSTRELHEQLRAKWQLHKTAALPQGKGKIKTILSAGDAGFIQGDDGQDYYFKTSWFQGPKHLLQQGQRVAFSIERNPNPDKRDMAKYVKPL